MLNMAVEEIAKACASTALILMVQELGTLPIRLFGSDELKQRLLPRCASGEWSPAFALSEPDAGSDPGGMLTKAVQDGDEWVINGTKNWITNLGIADFYVVFAVTDPQAGHSRGITAFVVEADRPGFSVGKLEHKLGIRGSPTGQPIFDEVRVPQENVVGDVNRGFKVAMATLDHSRLGVAAQALGIAQGATDYAAAYARERKQFGQPINSFQAIQFKLADMETQMRGCARAALPGVREDRPRRRRPRQVLGDGQAVLLRRRDARDGRGGAGARRLRLRQGVPGRADAARREDHADLRGHQRDPATRDRQDHALGAVRGMPGQQPTLRRILISALAALTLALGAASLIAGFSDSFPVRLIQGLAVFGAGAVIIGGAVVLTMIRLAGWREPESEMDFEAIVQRAERIAAGDALDDTDYDVDDEDLFDPYEDEDFKALVRGAIDELPLEFHRALEHVAIVVSDGGRRQRAYGLYQGDTVAQDYFHDRIVIFRDTLLRDFGHDPELLKAQVTRTVRHELAHHLGWDEKGVRRLGLVARLYFFFFLGGVDLAR